MSSVTTIDGVTHALFDPIDPSTPKVFIKSNRIHEFEGKRIVVCIDSWPRNSKYPLGHFVKVLS